VTIGTVPIQEAIAGDQQVFMELLEPLLPEAYRLAIAMLKTRADAEDAVQDAVLKAWKNFARFRRDSLLRPWLLTIVANECRHRRRSRWWSVVSDSDVPDQRIVELTAADPAAADLRRAIHRLPHDQRLVIVLRYYLDLPFDEVAQVLHVSTKAAKSRIYRALEKLRLSPEVLADE
jgi:RNA polymerase sigma-70 factor (ECF subfamily)